MSRKSLILLAQAWIPLLIFLGRRAIAKQVETKKAAHYALPFLFRDLNSPITAYVPIAHQDQYRRPTAQSSIAHCFHRQRRSRRNARARADHLRERAAL